MAEETTLYRIYVHGFFDGERLAQFAAVSIRYVNQTTVITAVLPDQSAVYGFLNRLRDLGVMLIGLEKLTTEDAENADN